MRTNVVIDDKLMAETLKASGASTKRAAIEEAKMKKGTRRERKR